MFNLIPISLLITAIGGIVYIVSNHLSELDNNDEENSDSFQFNFKARFIEWANQLPLGNVKSQSLSLTNKLLHRFRLTLLKTDNHLTKLIDKISQRDKMANGNSGNNNTPDFWEDFAKDQQQKQVVPPTADFVTPKANFVQPTAEPEVKIDLAVKSAAHLGEPRQGREAAKKFFDPVRNLSDKELDIKKPIKISNELSIKLTKVSNGVDIKPVKKTLRTKKSPK